MQLVTGLTRPRRLLTLGAVLATALVLVTLAQPRQTDAQAPFAPAPDLRVTAHELKYLNGPYFAPGYYLVITVRNTGKADAGPSTVEVRSQTNVLLQSFAMTAKQPGQGAIFAHRLPNPPRCGGLGFSRTIVVDAGNTVTEWLLGEGNNVTTIQGDYNEPC